MNERQPVRGASASGTVRNFLYFCAVFSVAPSAAVASLAVSSAVLGEVAATPSALLFGSYTLSALLLATPATTTMYGPKRAVTFGMALLGLYVLSLVAASAVLPAAEEALAPEDPAFRRRLASVALGAGAILGGVGAGVLWTAAGVYLALASSAAAAAAAVSTATPASLPSSRGSRDGVVLHGDVEDVEAHDVPIGIAGENKLAAWFAFVYLMEETILEAFSTVLVGRFEWSWTAVFGSYFALSVGATALMRWAQDYRPHGDGEVTGVGEAGGLGQDRGETGNVPPPSSSTTRCDKVTLATRQLMTDPKSKYLVGLPLAFGFAGGFFVSFVSGQVVPAALYDISASATATYGSVNGGMADSLTMAAALEASEAWVGTLTSLHGLVAAAVSLLVGYGLDRDKYSNTQGSRPSSGPFDSVAPHPEDRDRRPSRPVSIGSLAALVGGCLALAGVGATFLARPRADQWNLAPLVGLYAVHGFARAMHEGTVKAVHVTLYGLQPSAREGAFALVVLFHGIGSVVSYVVSLLWKCPSLHDPYCVEYRDGSRHNVKAYALCVVLISTAAALGYLRVWFLIQQEADPEGELVVAAEPDGDDHSTSTSPFWRRRRRSYQTVRSAERFGDPGAETELRELT